MALIDEFLKLAVKEGGADLHFIVGYEPIVRIDGDLRRVDYNPPTAVETERLLTELLSEEQQERLKQDMAVDIAYEIPGLARFRCNIYRQRRGLEGAFRVIPPQIRTAEELELPEVIKKMASLPYGLVLVTGPTGVGKTTTLAALIDLINTTRPLHIISIEDPIEFVHPNKKGLITQREVGPHTKSFAAALRAALREDPDVILVGEMRDPETISLAIRAAETGHLVFATLHTNTAVKSVDRILNSFPPKEQAQVRVTLSEILKGVVSQQLLRRKDTSGRIAAFEIFVWTPAAANLIREEKTFMLPSVIETGAKYGMQLMDRSLLELVRQEEICAEEAQQRAADKKEFQENLEKDKENDRNLLELVTQGKLHAEKASDRAIYKKQFQEKLKELDRNLLELVKQGKIPADEALRRAANKEEFRKKLKKGK